MGLVMQEPTLFNYTLKENILYGKMKATNSEIVDAATVANAIEFIEDKELSKAFDDDSASLLDAMLSEVFKDEVTEKLGREKFEQYKNDLEKIAEKDKKLGQF